MQAIALSAPPALPMAPGSLPGGKAAPKDAAQAFESMFASMLIKQMRQTLNSGQGFFGHDPSDILGGLYDHFMGQFMAQHGSLGIGAMIEKNLDSRSHKV
jgi:Rod binding domain-containing protein